jgi:membrane protease YdiL (CAAX protease family)
MLNFLVGEPSARPLNTETFLFQLTMPGLAEEITFRGIFLAILNRYLGKPWKIGSVSFGWGIILVTIMFVIGHTYHYDKTTHILEWTITSYMDYVNILMVSLAGIVFGYIREKSGSIWPGVLLHNIVNSFGIIADHLLWSVL